jgi:hypothetical protein
MVQLSATKCSCIASLWVSLVSFAAITLCVASQRVFISVSVYFFIDSVRKLFDTTSYIKKYPVIYICFITDNFLTSDYNYNYYITITLAPNKLKMMRQVVKIKKKIIFFVFKITHAAFWCHDVPCTAHVQCVDNHLNRALKNNEYYYLKLTAMSLSFPYKESYTFRPVTSTARAKLKILLCDEEQVTVQLLQNTRTSRILCRRHVSTQF